MSRHKKDKEGNKLKHVCEADGCQETAEAFCLTAKHFVCKEHHKPFHTVDGHPLRGVNIQVLWTWKV